MSLCPGPIGLSFLSPITMCSIETPVKRGVPESVIATGILYSFRCSRSNETSVDNMFPARNVYQIFVMMKACVLLNYIKNILYYMFICFVNNNNCKTIFLLQLEFVKYQLLCMYLILQNLYCNIRNFYVSYKNDCIHFNF